MITYKNKMNTWQISFFNEKIEKQILQMPQGIRIRFLRLAEIMEKHGPDLGMPHTRSMGQGLYEIRVKAPEGNGRFFYCTIFKHEIIVLHCFIKKSQNTPTRHLEIARKRLDEVKNV